jgi:hypothetical protein
VRDGATSGSPVWKEDDVIYPDSAHGFLFQRHAEFAAYVETFLSDPVNHIGRSGGSGRE